MSPPDLTIERMHSGTIIGIDEAGRGPWAGPVVAAAVVIDIEHPVIGLDDSKKLKAKDRDTLYATITKRCRHGVGIATVAEIDTHNILQASLIAMQRAAENLGCAFDIALVDGNKAPKLPSRVQTVVGGDAKCVSIAAASIIAKVTRDRIMHELAQEYPHYGWESNAGYGTPSHQRGLAEHGVCVHHRRSFAPIRALLEATDLFSVA